MSENNSEKNESEQTVPEQRFQMLGGKSIIELVEAMNNLAPNLGKLIYMGRNYFTDEQTNTIAVLAGAPFIAVFDTMPVLVETIEDQLTSQQNTDLSGLFRAVKSA